jgi:hypothetical protein
MRCYFLAPINGICEDSWYLSEYSKYVSNSMAPEYRDLILKRDRNAYLLQNAPREQGQGRRKRQALKHPASFSAGNRGNFSERKAVRV